jgi:hypothetical protein
VRLKVILRRQSVNWKKGEREMRPEEERGNQERIKRDREKWTWIQRVRGEVTSEKGAINAGLSEEKRKTEEVKRDEERKKAEEVKRIGEKVEESRRVRRRKENKQ